MRRVRRVRRKRQIIFGRIPCTWPHLLAPSSTARSGTEHICLEQRFSEHAPPPATTLPWTPV
jgi:hypothetical protein